jgi:hypothetical protein
VSPEAPENARRIHPVPNSIIQACSDVSPWLASRSTAPATGTLDAAPPTAASSMWIATPLGGFPWGDAEKSRSPQSGASARQPPLSGEG